MRVFYAKARLWQAQSSRGAHAPVSKRSAAPARAALLFKNKPLTAPCKTFAVPRTPCARLRTTAALPDRGGAARRTTAAQPRNGRAQPRMTVAEQEMTRALPGRSRATRRMTEAGQRMAEARQRRRRAGRSRRRAEHCIRRATRRTASTLPRARPTRRERGHPCPPKRAKARFQACASFYLESGACFIRALALNAGRDARAPGLGLLGTV